MRLPSRECRRSRLTARGAFGRIRRSYPCAVPVWDGDGRLSRRGQLAVANVGGGFGGYGPNMTVPTLLEVMNGQGNSPKIELSTEPGAAYYYYYYYYYSGMASCSDGSG